MCPWIYYLFGGAREQLAIYHGQQMLGGPCTPSGRSVLLYPVEYLTSVHGGSLMTDPNGVKQYRVADHLGSNRVTVIATTAQGIDYDPQGNAIAGVPPEQGYIRKEVDRESGLGDYSVRKYDGEDGEFPTVDEWWERYRGTSPYVYSFDNPVRLSDPSGRGGGVTGPRALVEKPGMGGGE